MKTLKFLTLLFFLTLTISSKAQMVTIPDPGFASYLQDNYPNCMSGNMLDITCADIETIETMVIPNNYSVMDVTGVEHFYNLIDLGLAEHPITFLPSLPMDLMFLNVGFCNLNSITNFPPSLVEITLSGQNNVLSSIPPLPSGLKVYIRSYLPNLPAETSLPSTLEYYSIAGSNIIDVAPLPSTLKDLDLSGNLSLNMPTFPAGLERLVIQDMNLTSLPVLPNSLHTLRAGYNDFTSLNAFPVNLKSLYVDGCSSLTTIENLPNNLLYLAAYSCALTSIDYIPNSVYGINLSHNNLNSIPNIPNSADIVKLEYNNLTSIPALPNSVNYLGLENNTIECLPMLPGNIQTITLDNNNFTCLPNILPAMSSTFQVYPLCEEGDLVNNPFGCASAEGIEGHVYTDQNTNCSFEGSDIGMRNVPMTVLDDLGNTIGSVSTFTDGRYYFDLGAGEYEVIVDTLDKPYEIDCVIPGIDSTLTLIPTSPLVSDVNFGMKCKDGFDVGTISVGADGFVFPGQPHTLVIKAGDATSFYNMNCSDGVSGTVTVTVNGPVTFQGVTSGSLTPTIAGNVYMYIIADFGLVDPNVDFRLDFLTDTTALTGDLVCVDVQVTPLAGDFNPENNDFSTCIPVVNSYDPNNKLVYPMEVEPGFDDDLTYTINFQNTGNAPAFNIRLEDTLSSMLDLATFRILDYSHDMHYSLIGNKLTVYFPNIMLIDSTTSEPDSKGYVTYRIKANGGTVDGDQIENTAHIFFDYNEAIVTNTAITEVSENQLGVNSLSNDKLSVYPNPSNGEFNLRIEENIVDLIVYNQQGKRIDVDFDSTSGKLDLSGEKSGFYFLNIILENSVLTTKVLKK